MGETSHDVDVGANIFGGFEVPNFIGFVGDSRLLLGDSRKRVGSVEVLLTELLRTPFTKPLRASR